MSSLFIFLAILILKSEARPRDNDLPSHDNQTYFAMPRSVLRPQIPNKTLRYGDKFINNNSLVNEVDRSRDNDPSDPLLVGFAGDPFKYSVTADEYLKEIRNMDLQMYKNKTGSRTKRNLIDLHNMIGCATDCDPLAYNGYGCFCGYYGVGIATDGIDRCCEAHDECYKNVDRPFKDVYLHPYLWHCSMGSPRCVNVDYGYYDTAQETANKMCECDRKFAMCLKRYQCPEEKPTCTSSTQRQLENGIISFILNKISEGFE